MVTNTHQAIGSVLEYLNHAVDNKLVSSVIRKDHKSLVFFHTIKDGAHHEHYLAFDAERFDEHFSKSVSVTLRKELKAKGRMAAGRYERYLGDCNLKVFLIKYDSFMRSMFPNPDFIAHFDKKDEAIAKTGCCESLRAAPSAQKAKVIDLSEILGEDDWLDCSPLKPRFNPRFFCVLTSQSLASVGILNRRRHIRWGLS